MDRLTSLNGNISDLSNRGNERQLCFYAQRDDALAADATIIFFFFTPSDKEVHINYSMRSTGDADVLVEKIVNPDDITGNAKQAIVLTSGIFDIKDDINSEIHLAITGAPSLVTVLDQPVLGGGQGAGVQFGTESGLGVAPILTKGQKYKFTLYNRNGASATLYQGVAFYTIPREEGLEQYLPDYIYDKTGRF